MDPIKKRQRAYGTHEIARMCQVTPPTVSRWISEKRISGFTTAGGHHRVWADDLVPFLEGLGLPVPDGLSRAGQKEILVVEDDREIREMVVSLLGRMVPSATVREAEDGFEAGQRFLAEKPDLVIIDVMLPGLDGERACRMMRGSGAKPAARILAISGRQDPDLRTRMIAAGADDFLPKPFTAAQLEEKVLRLLGIPGPKGRHLRKGDDNGAGR